MKIILIIFFCLILAGLAYFFYLGYKSQTGDAKGLVNSKLTPCAEKPNCICTEYPDDKAHFSSAMNIPVADINTIINAIHSTGGIVNETADNYIAATYTSKIFNYVDDFEVRIDKQKNLIHIRSASRVGHSDMGANLKRIKHFKSAVEKTLP